ncbi:MAG: hypothetical protein DSZ10_02000 [Sulfurovum sp.]|nr:MAG: hypothetical protein DSZ10_02000 [Sulfurovum sp.]
MKKKIILATIAALALAGCSNPMRVLMPRSGVAHKAKTSTTHYKAPSPEKEARFNEAMRKVALSTQNDPRYQKLVLDTPEKKKWFKNLMYRLWDRQITRAEFINEGLKKYPDHGYEFSYIANGFQNS